MRHNVYCPLHHNAGGGHKAFADSHCCITQFRLQLAILIRGAVGGAKHIALSVNSASHDDIQAGHCHLLRGGGVRATPNAHV